LVFKGSISHWFFNDAITAYVPLSKMPEWNYWPLYFRIWYLYHCFGLSTIFWVSLAALFFEWRFDGISVVIHQTILQLKLQIICGQSLLCKFYVVGSSNELGAFEVA
jgi:hypothetical protein